MASNSDLYSARNKLDGLLKELSEKSDESLEGSAIAIIDSLSSSMPPPSTPTKRSSSSKGPRKRRKKDLSFDDASDGFKSQSSYIMKLFDRNVDFAPFVEDTPLYTLAKEWMDNKPHRMKLASDMQDFQDSDPLSSSQGSTSSVLAPEPVDNAKAVYSLPPPKLKREKKKQSCIPQPLAQPPSSLNIHYQADDAPNMNELKQNHIQRWKKVKASWKQASTANQLYYNASIKAIRDLFEPFK